MLCCSFCIPIRIPSCYLVIINSKILYCLLHRKKEKKWDSHFLLFYCSKNAKLYIFKQFFWNTLKSLIHFWWLFWILYEKIHGKICFKPDTKTLWIDIFLYESIYKFQFKRKKNIEKERYFLDILVDFFFFNFLQWLKNKH